jgi:hypothetical protein
MLFGDLPPINRAFLGAFCTSNQNNNQKIRLHPPHFFTKKQMTTAYGCDAQIKKRKAALVIGLADATNNQPLF